VGLIVSQGKIIPLIAASEARELARIEAIDLHVSLLVDDVRELSRRLDELTGELHAYIGELRKDRGNS
jgi:hypothetical protein